jgi:hypothetical protein
LLRFSAKQCRRKNKQFAKTKQKNKIIKFCFQIWQQPSQEKNFLKYKLIKFPLVMRLVSALDCQLRPPAGPMKQKMIRLQKGKIKIKVSLAQIKWSKEIFPFVLAAEAPASKTKRYIDNITLPHK